MSESREQAGADALGVAAARLEAELHGCRARLAARDQIIAQLTERLVVVEGRLRELELLSMSSGEADDG
jgi:hypothetical protein